MEIGVYLPLGFWLFMMLFDNYCFYSYKIGRFSSWGMQMYDTKAETASCSGDCIATGRLPCDGYNTQLAKEEAADTARKKRTRQEQLQREKELRLAKNAIY